MVDEAKLQWNAEFRARQRLGARPSTPEGAFGGAFLGGIVGVAAMSSGMSEIGAVIFTVIGSIIGTIYTRDKQTKYDTKFQRLTSDYKRNPPD